MVITLTTYIFVERMTGQFPLPALYQPTVHGWLCFSLWGCHAEWRQSFTYICVFVSLYVYTLALGKREGGGGMVQFCIASCLQHVTFQDT